MSEWQPIETAPKDGTVILLSDSIETTCGYWGAPVSVFKRPDQWLSYWPMKKSAIGSLPTHWMPLPCPPADRA